MKKFLIILAVLIVLVGGGYFLYSFYLKDTLNPKPQVTMNASGGYDVTQGNSSTSINELQNPASYNFGVSIFPGAVAKTGDVSGAQMKSGNSTVTTGVFITRKSVDEVMSYYTKEFGPNAKVGQMTIGQQAMKTITLKDSKKAPIVTVSSDGNETTIQIVSVN